MNEATPDDMWTPFKYLFSVVESYLTSPDPETNITELEQVLRKHKQNFKTLLKNPPKNATRREEIRYGITEGITLPGLDHTILSKDLVDESIIISDMYDLNEYIALELLCTAQQQKPHHPGLPRGLVAILLYYDGRKDLVATLKELFQARHGISWCTDAPQEITQYITSYTDSLVEDGILDKIIDLLETFDITKELDILTTNRALGPPKHYRQVLDLFEEIRQLLATSLFNWSAQCGLPKNTTLKLINVLSKYTPTTESRGGIDDVTLTLLMTLMYALDTSGLQRREDGEEIVKKLPIISEEGFAQAIIDALNKTWECEGLRAMIYFSMGLSMATLRLAPQNIQSSALNVIDQDEALVDIAIQGKVFDFIYYILLDNEIVFKTEFFYRRMHVLLTDFIELMHSKVTELRARADETARTVQCFQQQGLDPPPNLCRDFETLLQAVGKLYGNDKLGLSLGLEYWGPMDIPGNYQRTSSRSVSLFKFIRLAGELLPPILFIPYLKMLAGLSSCQQSARNAFNLLKQGSGVSGSTTISWDHFFGSLTRYYSTLRQEQNPGTETIYRSRVINRVINPQEIAGLQAVLDVIRAVANNDEVARIALCEHPTWMPLHVLLGLVSCSIEIPLKADLLLTLAALAKSKETAIKIWNNLETSQIITTIPSTNTFNTRGIESELEQVESRKENYPLTQAILELLYVLTSTIVPKNLGAGPRKPGLDPYVTFIIDSVFLKFYNRNYKDQAEKWAVAEKCLKLLNMFIKTYEINPSDFPVNGVIKEENAPPGFHIMLAMQKESDLLRLILYIIDIACVSLDEYVQFPGRKNLEQCSLYCLNIIERSLSQQELFFDAHYSSNCSILIAGINKLLLGVNPRSGKPDHMLNFGKFITYNSWLQKHTLISIKILTYIIRQPNVNSQLLGIFTQTEKIKNEIRHGFVECLEYDISNLNNCDNTDDDDTNNCPIELAIKEAILNLLQESLPQSPPNLAHYLLGFDITKNIRLTRLQQPGVMDFPSTCAKSLIIMLDNALEAMKSGRASTEASYECLIENGYSVLYILCNNTNTSEVFLRFLRSYNDFLCRHLSALPFRNNKSPHVLNQMTGLLKSVAIELKITAANNQITQFGNLCKILLGVVHNTNPENSTLQLSHYNSIISNTTTVGDTITSNRKIGDNSKLLLSQLLDCLNFEMKSINKPKWDFFDNSLMQNLLQSCELSSLNGPKLIDIKKLHDILKDELKTVQSSMAAGQRQLILQEIEAVLMFALRVNTQKNICASTIKFLEAWGQVTEILFSVAPSFDSFGQIQDVLFNSAQPFSLSIDIKQELILEILQVLLNKVVPSQIMSELANLSSSTLLSLLVNLRHCYIIKNKQIKNNENNTIQTTQYTTKSNTLNLKYILKNIIEWIIISGVSSQKLRVNLYASLLNFMHIIKGNDSTNDDDTGDANNLRNNEYISCLDKSMNKYSNNNNDNQSNHTQMAIDVFTSFGDNLIDILCHDCTGGLDVCTMSSLSCIDMLLDMDSMCNLIQFMSKRGYLSHLIDSLIKSDKYLCHVLDNKPENLKALYVYESKMAMLSRVGSSYLGAELLLEERVLGVLAGMKVYDLHPDFQVNQYIMQTNITSFIPPIEVRYQQILFPALNLCDVILSTLGPDDHSAITQVIHFLLSHGDMIEIVLRAGTPFLNLGLLQELSAITGLIARVTNQAVVNFFDDDTNNLGAHLYRLQKLILILFPRFLLASKTIKKITQTTETPSNYQHNSDMNQTKNMIYFLQIACNLSLYVRNAIANHSADHRITSVLFSPNIIDGNQKSDQNSGTLDASPSLGLVVSQLKFSVEYFNREKLSYDGLLRQKSSLPTINLDSNVQQVHHDIVERITNKQAELKLCTFLIEHCLYLLWAHLDYYMLRSLPINSLHINNSFNHDNLIMSSAEAGWKVTSDDISTLKNQLIKVFNETFCKELILTTQDQSASDKGFIEALVRRIKRLIQFVPV